MNTLSSRLMNSTRNYLTRVLVVLILLLLCEAASAQELYVGANYHPQDSNPETWKHDIALMKAAGFRVVRMGHLAWDSYEPADGKFDFAWFDQVMEMMHKAGIKVILDIAVRPAPLWLHHEHPSIGITGPNGNLLYPNTRYMEDVGNAIYQKYALRYADALVRHYRGNPALLAFGIDNEPGDGPISYSEDVRARFIAWLKQKYTTVEALNHAWAGQRWSRRIGDFDEVGLPMPGYVSSQPERVLDFRLFMSDEINDFLLKLIDRVNTLAPGALTTGNMWYYSPRKYFDYSAIAYSGKLSRGGCGLYPGDSLVRNDGLESALFGMERIQFENTTPFWLTEFISSTATPGAIRKAAYASLMFGGQVFCGWTWQTMHSGEEQFLEGLVDWDGIPNRKYEEYKQIATEFRKIERFGFPYRPRAEVALAFSFPSQIVSAAFPESHEEQLQTAFNAFFTRNIDTRVVEISRSSLPYKLLVIPGVASIDDATARKIRQFVHDGGTVIMTGYSALVDEHGRVFDTTRPGRLSDVFGIRLGGYESVENMNEISRLGLRGQQLHLLYAGKEIDCESPRFDIVDPKGAKVEGTITSLDRDYPIITSHKFGAGRAIYIGLPARSAVLDAVLDQIIERIGVTPGPKVPAGVMARKIDPRHVLYLNIEGTPKEIPLDGRARSILHDREYSGSFTLPPYKPEFLEMEKP
jgi:beta-galactosidase